MSYRPILDGCWVVYKVSGETKEMWAICGQEHQARQTRGALETNQPTFEWIVEEIAERTE